MRLFRWVQSVMQRRRFEANMDAELRFHIDSYTADLISDGMPEAEARRRARLEFGNLENKKEDCRASLSMRLWDELRADLRYGTRMLRQSPIFTGVAVISLALGIGANTAIFALAHEMLYQKLGVPNAESLRMLNWSGGGKWRGERTIWGSTNRTVNGDYITTVFPWPAFLDLRKRQTFLEDLAGFKDMGQMTAVTDGGAESVKGELLSGNFYRALGARVSAGRPIMESDDQLNAPPVVVISDGYWSRRFGRSAEAIGKTIRVNSVPVTIIGVNAPEFTGAEAVARPEVFLPITLIDRLNPQPEGSLLKNPDYWWVLLIGRLKPGISTEAAQSVGEMELTASFRATLPVENSQNYPTLVLTKGDRGYDNTESAATPMYLLLGSAALVLLIACVNLAGLLLARGATRNREMGVRIALGASRFRIFRQAMTETMLLALLGGGVGCLLAVGACRLLVSRLESLPEVPFNWNVLSFAIGVTTVTGILFGIAPALRMNVEGTSAALQETNRLTRTKSRTVLRKALVAVQIALSLVLLVGAGLFVRTLMSLKSVDLGFNPEHVLLFSIDPPRAIYQGDQRLALFEEIRNRISALPGVQSIGASQQRMLAGSMSNRCVHRTSAPGREAETTPYTNIVSPGFFETVGIPVVLGRSFNDKDNKAGPMAAVANRKLAQQLFPGENPLGQTLAFCNGQAAPVQIIGIAGNAKYSDVDRDAPPTLYLPYLQQGTNWDLTFEVKTAASNESMVRQIRKTIASIDMDLPLLGVRTQREQIESTLFMQATFAQLTSGFGLLALSLAAIGIYGIVAYNAAQRTNEIGIRMTLGAQPFEILHLVLREVWLLAILGMAIGAVASFGVTRLIENSLFGVKPNDPISYVIGGLLLLGCALLAGLIPARRASRIDPCEALRHE